MARYTDIASEIFKPGVGTIPRGVTVERLCTADIEVTRVAVKKDGLHRPKGNYAVVDMPNFAYVDDRNDRYISIIANEVSRLLPPKGLLLVVGLGNKNVTADSLGPLTAQRIFVTRHLEKQAQKTNFALREVAAFVPGVTARTGLDTKEVLCSIIKELSPSAVIIVDSLYSTQGKRLGCTVQVSDAGISPGGAYTLDSSVLGCPVVAIGVPTLMQSENSRIGAPLVVTLRELDSVMAKASNLLSVALNRAAQKSLSSSELNYLVS